MGTSKEHISLSHLNTIIQSTLNNTFSMQYFWVVADITEHSFKEATGYHYFEHKGKITGDPKQFLPGSEIEVILGTQSIKSTVNTNTEYHGNDFNLPESL